MQLNYASSQIQNTGYVFWSFGRLPKKYFLPDNRMVNYANIRGQGGGEGGGIPIG